MVSRANCKGVVGFTEEVVTLCTIFIRVMICSLCRSKWPSGVADDERSYVRLPLVLFNFLEVSTRYFR